MCYRTEYRFDDKREPERLPETSAPPRVRRLVGALLVAAVAVVAAWTLPDILNAKAPQEPQRSAVQTTPPAGGETGAPVRTALVDDEVPTAAGPKVASGHCDH